MSLNYKNPISPISFLGNSSVPRDQTYGTNYSVLSTGGYMEVYSLSDLNYQIPSGNTGLIEYSANTIPIQFNKGLGTIFSPDVLTLHSDNISSGRRKLGMLVYVYETDKIYQHTIDNYDLLWTAATNASGPGGQTVVISEFGTTIKNNSVAGQNFINVWTASTIEGVSGYTNLNATWRVLQTGGGGTFTGGTVTGDTIFTSGLTANTFSASTYLGLPADIFITGGTFDTSTDTLTLERSSGSTITITGFTDYYTTAFTYSSNTLTIYDNSGNTFPVTINDFTGLTINGSLSATTISATTYQNLPIDPDTYVTGFTYSSNTFTISDNSGNTFDATFNEVTGLTINGNLSVTGNTILNGLTANTISANTYQNLPIDPDTYVTGFTYSANTFTILDNSGNTFNATFNSVTGLTINGNLSVTGNTNLNGLTANTISAATYQNLPTDFNTFVTGFTYSANTFTISDNSGNTFDATFNNVTGLTVNGGLSAITFSALTIGSSGDCVDDLYVSNIHSCSPLNINPLNEGNVYFGSTSAVTIDLSNNRVGIGITSPTAKLHIVGNGTGTTYGLKIDDSLGQPNFHINDDGVIFFGNDGVGGSKKFISAGFPNNTFVSVGYDVLNNYIQDSSTGNGVVGFGLNVFKNLPTSADGFGFGYNVFSNVSLTGGRNVAFGASLGTNVTSGTQNLIFGYNTANNFTTGSYNIQVAHEVGGGNYSNTLAFGHNFNLKDNNTIMFGGIRQYKSVQWNDDVTDGIFSFTTFTEKIASVANGTTSNTNGWDWTYEGSRSTGQGTGGAFIWKTTPSGVTSSSTQNALVEVMRITGEGNVGVGISTPSSKLEVNGRTKTTNFTMTSGATNGYVLTSDGSGNASWSPVSGASGYSDVYVTGFTYSANTFTISDNSGNTFDAIINDVTGLTVNGDLSLVNLSANTITATTIDLCTNNGTLYTDSISGCSPINILSTSIFNDGLSANTISGGTFYGDGSNLSNVVNSLTTSTGLSANTTTGNITILNTAPDQIVTLSGGTGILTGGTYPNFEITNTSPDLIVTISGGTNISIGGSYPNFTISNTGSTGFTGGTVTGATSFTGGLTANTISATTITGTTLYGDASNLTNIPPNPSTKLFNYYNFI